VVINSCWESPAVKTQLYVTIIIISAPYRAQRNACARLVVIVQPHLLRHVFDCPVVHVAIETVLTFFDTVRNIDVSPAVAVEINNGDSRATPSDLRQAVIELGITRRGLMLKINAGSLRHFYKTNPVA